MSALSRRSLVTTAAALPALAVPAVAVAVDHPDAWLIALGKELADLLPVYNAALDELDEANDRSQQLAGERTGFDYPNNNNTRTLRRIFCGVGTHLFRDGR